MENYQENLKSLFANYDALVFFDFETTGLSPWRDDIIEIGAVCLEKDNDEPVTLSTLVQLNKHSFVPSKITQITGITSKMLSESGIPLSDARNSLYQIMAKHEKTLIIAHNILFDLGFLYQLFYDPLYRKVIDRVDCLDTLTVFRDRRPYPHRLANAITAYNLEEVVKNSHRALDDVMSLVYILSSMIEEQDDIIRYVNLIGYNPNYPAPRMTGFVKIRLLPQSYTKNYKLYNIA